MSDHHILDSSNNPLAVTNFGTGDATTDRLGGLPLGTSDGSPTGEVVLKVKTVGAGAGGASTIADGADVAQGTTTDAPIADNTTLASATAATGVSLWKRLVNLGVAILAKLPTVGTAGTASANVVTVQGIASGTVVPVSLASTILAAGTALIGKINLNSTGLTTLQNAATATGNGTSMDVSNITLLKAVITISASAQITVECSMDDSTYFSVPSTDLTIGNNYGAQNSANGLILATKVVEVDVSAWLFFRARVSSFSSGTVTVKANGIAAGTPENLRIKSTSNVVANADGRNRAYTVDITGSTCVPDVSLMIWNGASSDALRKANLFRTLSTQSTGSTSLIPVNASKKHRILEVDIFVSAEAATSGGAGITITILDVAAATGISCYVPVPATGLVLATSALGVAGGFSYKWKMGNGILCAAINTVVNLNLSAALTAGFVTANIGYTDE